MKPKPLDQIAFDAYSKSGGMRAKIDDLAPNQRKQLKVMCQAVARAVRRRAGIEAGSSDRTK